jgi:glycosyltransferase involved in cell wall biosynthesis
VRSVLVTKFLPLPADSGGKQRSLAVLTRLTSLGEVVLCAFDDERADHAGLAGLGVDVRCVPWRPSPARVARGVLHAWSGSAGRFWDADLAAIVGQAVREAHTDVLQVEYATLVPYLKGIQAPLRVLDMHNIESSLAASYARNASPLKALPVWLEAAALRGLEWRGLRAVDVVAVVSGKDRARLPSGPSEVLVCPNGWNPTGPLPPAADPVVAFVALMGWRPNADAAVWLVEEVWPLVRAQLPEARLLLVGRSPGPRVQRLAAHDITVTGTVPDPRPYLAQTRVTVAPLLSGGGTRLKVLESLDAGRPVVATPIGAEGLEDLVGDGVTVTETATAMADSIVAYLADPERAARDGARGSRAVAERYAWDIVLDPLMDRIRAAVAVR